MNPNPILQWLQNLEPEIRRGVAQVFIIAALFPVMMIISSFGNVSFVHFAPLWFMFLIATATLVWALFHYEVFPVPVMCVVGAGLLAVSLMGATDTTAMDSTIYVAGPLRYIGTLAGIAFAIGADLILATAAWIGTFTIVGVVAGLPGGLHFRDIPESAQSAFEGIAIVAFWLALTGLLSAVIGPRVPYQLMLLLLAIALVVVPGALVLAGRTSIRIAWGIMVVLLLAGLVISVWFALDSMGVWGEIGVTARVHNIKFRFNGGLYTPDPIQSVQVGPGDRIVFDAVGAVSETGVPTSHSIRGTGELIKHGDWYRQKGEVFFRIARYEPSGGLVSVPVMVDDFRIGGEVPLKSGPYKTGYAVSGTARVPQNVHGHLLIDFYRMNVADASVTLAVKVLPEKSATATLGRRILGVEDPTPKKGEWRTFVRIVFLSICSVWIGLTWWLKAYTKEGWGPHMLSTIAGILLCALLFLGYEWIAYGEGGFTTAWSWIKTVWRR